MEQKDVELNYSIYEKMYQNKIQNEYEPFLEIIAALIQKNNFKSVIDFACGTGKLGLYLREKEKQLNVVIDAVEISETAKKIAEPFYNFIDIRKDYLLPDKKYDLIVLNSIIEHITDENLDILFGDIKNKLNPGGKIFIAVPNRRFMLLFSTVEKEKNEKGHINLKSFRQWKKFFKSKGFINIKTSFYIKYKYINYLQYFISNAFLRNVLIVFYPILNVWPFYHLKSSYFYVINK